MYVPITHTHPHTAYEIISDPKKRELYDQYGLEGVEQEGGPGGAGGEDLFSMFFGGGRGRSAGPRKGPSLQHALKVSLNDLYNGKTVKLAINRKVIVGESNQCSTCHGQGAVMEMRQIGPGMITQMQRACSDCGGQGYRAKTKNERKVVEVHVEKGAANNQKITFRGMADEVPGRETGDVNFIIQEKEHDLFKRKGADLLVMQDISLNQALTGFSVSEVQYSNDEYIIYTIRQYEHCFLMFFFLFLFQYSCVSITWMVETSSSKPNPVRSFKVRQRIPILVDRCPT